MDSVTNPAFARIGDAVDWWAARSPAAEAVVDGDVRLGYAALAARAEAMARAMIAAGVAPGDRVACLVPPSIDFLVSFLAAGSIGAIWLGLNPRYRPQELRYLIGDCTPTLLLARDASAPEMAALAAEFPAMRIASPDPAGDFLAGADAVDAARFAARRAGAGGRQPCMIVYTSGSTGKPKGAVLHHEGVIAFSHAQNRLWPISPQRVLNYFPINHIGCVVDLCCPTLAAGGTIVFMEKFDPRGSLALMEQERVTLWASVPSVFQMQLDLPEFADFDLSAVQLVVWEGAPMSEVMVRRLLGIAPRLATNYGMTEATSAIMAMPPSRDAEALAHSVGLPFEGAEVRLVLADGSDAAPGETGEVRVHSRLNMLGYWNRPEETAAAFDADGYFRTGDLARLRPDGRYAIAGRLKEMFKSGGYNVYPLEVEAVIEAHPAVAGVAVVGIPDPLWNEVGYAFVAASAPVGEADLIAHCRAALANYKVPKRIIVRAELPLLPIGKVDKVALRGEAMALAQQASEKM